MTSDIEIRTADARDLASLRELYASAFPDEDLFPLVSNLLGGAAPILSLVAMSGGRPVGHVVFTHCTVDPGAVAAALLGPLCVTPGCQKGGIGSALVRAGFEDLKAQVSKILVLGDPGYYGRFGFKPDPLVEPPRPIPVEWKDAWQSVRFDDRSDAGPGRLTVPDSWKDPSLWSA